MRFRMPREFYIPKNATVVRSKNLPAVVYLSNDGKPSAMGFYGKADKPSFNFIFRDEARRAKHVSEWFDSMAALEAGRLANRAAKKAFVHSLKVGDILHTSWGYDQTNVEFFQVTALVGKAMVEIRELAQESEETGFMTGQCVPVANKFCGEPLRKRVLEGNSLNIHGSFGYAHLCSTQNVGGVSVVPAQRWSSYA